MSDFKISDAKEYIQSILDLEFPNNAEKRRIKPKHGELQFACPHCHDSAKDNSAKRGTLYVNSFRYVCYNCDYRSNLLGLLKKFSIRIDPSKKMDLIKYVEDATSKMSFNDDEFASNHLDKLIDLDKLTEFFNNQNETPIKLFKPIEKGSHAQRYLAERKIFNYENLYEGVYEYSEDWREDIIIYLNASKGKVLGIQTRNLKQEKHKRKFRIFSFTELYNYLYPDNDLDELEQIGYNRLSYLYNILNVSWESSITVFEGFLDTKFIPNSIGCVGTNTDINFILNQDADIRFFYDYDDTGIRKSIEMISRGYSVFLWEKLFDFWSSKTNNPNKAGRELRSKIKDMNDVAKIIDNPYMKLEMNKKFSIDELDKIYIKKVEKLINI